MAAAANNKGLPSSLLFAAGPTKILIFQMSDELPHQHMMA